MQTNSEADPILWKKAIEDCLHGSIPREGLILFLQWEMAAAQLRPLLDFIAEVKKNYEEVDPDLVREITATSRYVQHWDFPEESGLSEALPGAIECSLPELVMSISRVVGRLGHVRNMLAGVNVRLNLLGAHAAFEEALHLVQEQMELLERACVKIGDETGLAPALPGEAAEKPSWVSPGGAPLSPDEIILLADLARWNDMDFSVSYKDGLRAHSTPPQLVTEQVRASEEQLAEAEKSRGLAEQIRRAMVTACPRCGSAPGARCRTGAGKVTTMHKMRYADAS